MDDYWDKDIVVRLRERADAARSENTGTAISDATHFEQAADEIEKLRLDLQSWEIAAKRSDEAEAARHAGRYTDRERRLNHDIEALTQMHQREMRVLYKALERALSLFGVMGAEQIKRATEEIGPVLKELSPR